MKRFVFLICLFTLSSVGVNASEYKALTLPKIQVVPIKDTNSDKQYELYIKLPEEYSKDSGKKYPVIYTTDAMWHIEILSGSAEFVVEDAILVGISWQKDMGDKHEFASRYQDYTLIESKTSKYKRGQASKHLAFIREDVIKYVESTYQTDPAKRTYFGYSLGAEFGAYVLLSQPDSFKNYILGSPTVSETKEENIFNFEPKGIKQHKDLNANVFISYGELETELGKKTENFITELKSRNYANLSIEKGVVKSADHGKAFPMTTVRSMYWLEQYIENKK